MGHTYTCLLTHVVFSTKDRIPFLAPDDTRKGVHPYIGGIIKRLGGKPLSIGGVSDHVHILMELPAKIDVSQALSKLKAGSSGWIKDQWPRLAQFSWQTGYSAFSVSRSAVSQVAAYIENQEEHHKKYSFKEELIKLLKKHGIEYDERFLWS